MRHRAWQRRSPATLPSQSRMHVSTTRRRNRPPISAGLLQVSQLVASPIGHRGDPGGHRAHDAGPSGRREVPQSTRGTARDPALCREPSSGCRSGRSPDVWHGDLPLGRFVLSGRSQEVAADGRCTFCDSMRRPKPGPAWRRVDGADRGGVREGAVADRSATAHQDRHWSVRLLVEEGEKATAVVGNAGLR